MRRVLTVIFAICYLLAISSMVSAKEEISLAPRKTEIESTGITLSTSDFSNLFSGNPGLRKRNTNQSVSETNMVLSSIQVNGTDVSAIVRLDDGEEIVALPIKGKLAASHKTQQNINSAVVQVHEQTDGYEVLLFEIFNDTLEDNLLLENSTNVLDGVPHIKLYLKNAEDKMFLFEAKMPEEFRSIDAFEYDQADNDKDSLWALQYVDVCTKELATDDQLLERMGANVQTRALNAYSTWYYPTTYYTSYYIGSEFCELYSVPYVEYKHVNVTTSDSTWIGSFKVLERSENTTPTNTYIYYGVNAVQYHNIEMAFACGDNTTFIRTFQSGRVHKNNIWNSEIISDGQALVVELLQTTLEELPGATVVGTVIRFLNNMVGYSGSVVLGSPGVTLLNRKTVAVGERIDGCYLKECTDHSGLTNNGDYFTFQAVLNYEDAGSPYTTATGILSVEFDVQNDADDTYTSKSKRFSLNYTVTP